MKTYDLSVKIQEWVGSNEGKYTCEIELDLRVGPDGNCDTVDRLTILDLRSVTAKVIQSDVPIMVVVGHKHIEHLMERKN